MQICAQERERKRGGAVIAKTGLDLDLDLDLDLNSNLNLAPGEQIVRNQLRAKPRKGKVKRSKG